jgi:hypothetical protein
MFLLDANRFEDDILLRKQLEEFAAHPSQKLKVCFTVD